MAEPGNSRGRSTIRLVPMEVPKASDVLATELRERILSGEYAEGSPLPPERELVTQTTMSRATVREALRILEVQGLVRIKAGRAGGAFVQRPGKESLASSMALLIRGRQIRLAALHETREAIEPFCAELAAKNRTDDDLAALDAADEAISDPDASLAQFLQANVDWHIGVATASHNELLGAFMTAFFLDVTAATENEFVNDDVRRLAAKAHRGITDAIRKRDAEAAVRRMRRHVHGYAQAVLKIDQREAITVPDEG